jgi:hypothetical protein
VETRLPRVGCLLSCLLFLLAAVPAFSQQVSPQALITQPLIIQPIDESQLTTLKGNTHPLAQPQFDIGVAAPNLPLQRMLLVLKRSPQQDFALRKLLDDQQDKASPNFHKWLTPDEFGAYFGPSDQDVQLITGWLQSHGFQVNRVTHGRSIIEFSGVESQLESAFHTQIHAYAVNGQQHWANASYPQIPTALAPAVAGVWSLHDFHKKTNIQISPLKLKTKYVAGARPNTTFSNGAHALAPADFATIYNLNPLYNAGITGQGLGIAVVARSDMSGVDLPAFRGVFGLCCGSLQIINDGPDPGDLGGGEEAEATLDASWSGAIAPSATLDFVVSASTNTTDGVDLSELYIVDNDVAPIMTESFSTCEGVASPAEAQAISALAEQAAAEGITYMVSSGDSGAAECDDPNSAPATHGQSVNLLASTAFNVAVGGTQFNEHGNPGLYWGATNNQSNLGSALKYIPEDVWNESCSVCQSPNLFSSGGGASILVANPTWQFGVQGIPAATTRRLVPDVSLNAAAGNDPYLLCLESSCTPDAQGFISFAAVGGTSASAPSFAGIMALVNQQNGPQGQANYVLYRLAAVETLAQCDASNTTTPPASTCVFNDVTTGNNSVPGQTGFTAGTGYDAVTGLGSVNATNLVNNWANITFTATTATLGPNSVGTTHGMPVTLTASVAPNSGPGIPTGDVSLNTSNGQNVGFLTLTNGSVSSSVSNLPGGTYTLTARYSGDKTFAPSPPSSPVNVTVTPENSTTTASIFTIAPNGAPIPFSSGSFGGFVFFRADVASVSGNGTPSRDVWFYDNGNLIFGATPLNSQGNAGYPFFSFTGGRHSLTAFYGGDSSFNSSTSAPVTFTITPATTSISVSASPSGGPQGIGVTLTANMASPAFAGAPPTPFNYPSPTGTGTFWNGNTQIGTGQLFAFGQTQNGVNAVASFTTTSLPNGSNSITAQYGGDTNFLGSSSSPLTVNISADFTFVASNPTVAVNSPGGSNTNLLTITGQTGYNSTISFSSLSCSGLPYLSSCSFSPSTVTGSGSTTLTISTTAPSSAAARPLAWTSFGFVFAGILAFGVPLRRRRSPVTRTIALSVVFFCVTLGNTACGGGSSGGGGGGGGGGGNPGTPVGTYGVTVTAVTTDGVVSHTANFSLVVR